MEALILTRKEYEEGLIKASGSMNDDGVYLNRFKCRFPEGLNLANPMEICRTIQDSTFENKIRLTKICIAGKIVEIECPNGDKYKITLSSPEENLDAFDVFHDDPLALVAISDTVYGYILKKSLRLSKPKEPAAKQKMD